MSSILCRYLAIYPLALNKLVRSAITSLPNSAYSQSIHRSSLLLGLQHFHTTPISSNKTSVKTRNMSPLPGGCYCGLIKYTVTLEDPESQARTSICHCGNCKKFTGGEHGITTKIPKTAFKITQGTEHVKVHEADNGSGVLLHREFCDTCGGPLLEYGANAGDNIYVFYGTMEDHARGQVEPKGEFFCKLRDPWMPSIEGLFQKQEIKQ
ncbi:Mss4-like protein [Daldinia bambusicola]|nr:Mss4-like protein [Daldinia bambusicola]